MRSFDLKSALAGAGALAMLAVTGAAQAETRTYGCDPGHSEVRFSWTHAGFSTQTGEFTAFDCKLVLVEDNPDKSTLSVTLKTDSISTGVPDLDKDLKSENFFNAAKNPDIKFESTKVDQYNSKSARVTGNLTIGGISNPVTLTVKLVKKGEHPVGQFFDYYKGQWAGFSATTTVKRSKWKIDKYVPLMSDEIAITINTEMKAQ